MKNIAPLSLSAVLVTALITLVLGSVSLYAAVPSLFLLLIAAEDYAPKRQRIRIHARVHSQNLNTPASTQRLPLAA
ncbi:MAG TPA: hypothetical protein VL069_12720 [Opitutus sp.]|nr:hypothetical protein [Opitutus sp.]